MLAHRIDGGPSQSRHVRSNRHRRHSREQSITPHGSRIQGTGRLESILGRSRLQKHRLARAQRGHGPQAGTTFLQVEPCIGSSQESDDPPALASSRPRESNGCLEGTAPHGRIRSSHRRGQNIDDVGRQRLDEH